MNLPNLTRAVLFLHQNHNVENDPVGRPTDFKRE
jgi:hypothetical protein